MVSADSDRVSRAPPYSGTNVESRSFSFTRLSRSMAPLPRGLQLTTGLVTRSVLHHAGPTTPIRPKSDWFGLLRFRSPLLSQSRFLSFPSGTEMVHFPEFARTRLCIHRAVPRFYRGGFPHSDIPELKPACGSSRLIAACHVLHRHLLPRHPPCALSNLTIKFTQSTRCLRGEVLSI